MGFEVLQQLIKNTSKLKTNSVLQRVFNDKDIQLDMAKRNVEQMYNDGIDSNGNSLGEYSAVTVKIKQSKGQRHDHITLRDTREFHNSIEVESESKNVVIRGDMKKSGGVDLEERFPNALGLTDDNFNDIKEKIIPRVGKIVLDDMFDGM